MSTPQRFRRVLLTNDDGIDAPGMVALEAMAAELADEVWVVAPQNDQSGVSHALSIHNPLRVIEKGERRFAVTGTPTDSVVIGLRHVLKGQTVDAVFSGVNRGANMGLESVYSGTIAGAMAGHLLKVPSVALSQSWRDSAHIPWATSVTWGVRAINALRDGDGLLPTDCIPNINFPDVPPDEVEGMGVSHQGRGALLDIIVETRADRRGNGYHWLGFERGDADPHAQSDAGLLRRRLVSITPLGFNRFVEAAARGLEARLDHAGETAAA